MRPLAASTVLAALACATTPALIASGPSALDYAPLEKGAAWTYDVEYPGQKGELTVRLVSEEGGYFMDDKNGALRHTAEGLRDRDRYLIRHPIQAGTSWKSVVGPSAVEHIEIESAGQACECLAGRFEDCVVVHGRIRRDKDMQLHIYWTWARSVGLVKLETVAEIAGQGMVPQVKQSLKAYSKSGGAEPAPSKKDDGPDSWTAE